MKFDVRMQLKSDTTAAWNAHPQFVPLKGEVIVYTDYEEIERDGVKRFVPNFKIGDGNAYCVDLPFVNESIRFEIMHHTENESVHVSDEDRLRWDNKVSCDVDDERLILTTT